MGVTTPILSERKSYPYIMDAGSPIPFQKAVSFSYMLNFVGVTTSTLFPDSYEKIMGVSH